MPALSILMLVVLTACQMLPVPQQTPAGQRTETPDATQSTSQISPTPQEVSNPTDATAGPITLRVWLPAQFDPSAGTPAGDILFARLREFTSQNPNVRIEVRLKAMEGEGGLLESLAAANAAAPRRRPVTSVP